MTRRFTGWHMTAIFVVFFGIVVTVNVVMARYAIGTFGGKVVDNSYVASQNYNRWLKEADAQAKLGWVSKISLGTMRRVKLSVSKNDTPLDQVVATGRAIHPLGHAPSIPLTFVQTTPGQLLTNQSLPAGRWRMQINLRRGSDTFKQIAMVQ